jgi:hypothetical protein
MRRLMTTVLLALAITPATAFAGQIWTDANGDGLADPADPFPASVSDNVTVRIFFDSQSFTWTNFQAWLEWQPGLTFNLAGSGYDVAGGTNFPIDTFSRPNSVGFAGFGFQGIHGISMVAHAQFHIDATFRVCALPIINPEDPYGVFSILGTQSTYFLFQTGQGSCWQSPVSTSPATWGKIKGIYQ